MSRPRGSWKQVGFSPKFQQGSFEGTMKWEGSGHRVVWSPWSSDTYENLYLSPLRSFLEKTFCKLE